MDTARKYRKKPVVIEAIKFKEDNMIDVLSFCNEHGIIACSNDKSVSITTLEGTMVADIGDYIIRGIKGEHYPCKADIFEATYEKVETTEEEDEARDIGLSCGNIKIELNSETLKTIVDELEIDPDVIIVEYEENPIQLKFTVDYNVGRIKEASFTIYEGATLIREAGVYRTER